MRYISEKTIKNISLSNKNSFLKYTLLVILFLLIQQIVVQKNFFQFLEYYKWENEISTQFKEYSPLLIPSFKKDKLYTLVYSIEKEDNILYFDLYRDSNYNILSQKEFYNIESSHTLYDLFYSFEKSNRKLENITLTNLKKSYNVDVLKVNRIEKLNSTIYDETLIEYNGPFYQMYYSSLVSGIDTINSKDFQEIVKTFDNIDTDSKKDITIAVIELAQSINFRIQFKKNNYYYYLGFNHIDNHKLDEIILQINNF